MLDLTSPQHAHAAARLHESAIVWLNTVRPDGRPHSVPVWFLLEGNSVIIFSQPDNQKVRNLRHDPRVMLGLDDTHDGEDVVMLEGSAELLDATALSAAFPAYTAKYGARVAKLFGTLERMAAQYRQGIRITPTRLITM